jgi:signal transduction histidine kinase
MFRIFQESLTNVARHSQATEVKVRVSRHDGRVVLEVDDNGRGITKSQAMSSRSFGLLGMRERARMFGGELRIKTTEDKGTTVRAQIPF